MKLHDNITTVKNVGKKRAEKLETLGINIIYDLLEYFPRTYDDRSKFCLIEDVIIDEVNVINATVITSPQNIQVNNMLMTKAKIKDETGILNVVWYNKRYIKSTLRVGHYYIFTGKVSCKCKTPSFENPEYIDPEKKEVLSTGRIVPVYKSTYKFPQNLFRTLINEILSDIKDEIEEFLPKIIIDNNNLCTRDYAIRNIHFPKDDDAFFEARKRLVFEELFLLQMKILELRGNLISKKNSIIIKDISTSDIIDLLPFDLTNAQKKVIDEIKLDLNNNKVMNRLLQGDVGSGKTAVAKALCYIGINNGYQVAVMAPTDVLAGQHFKTFSKDFDALGYTTIFLSGSKTKKQKEEIYGKIESGEVNIIIGTHAVIQEGVKFQNLGIVITDEQHRFGVNQRQMLSQKGENPHTLVMTATPIPRTLALILYGNLDISIIDAMPIGRKKIDTSYVGTTYYGRIYKFISENVAQGRQTYIVCPIIEQSDKKELKSVLEYTENLKNNIFPNYNVECIYGKLKAREKQAIMDKFYKNEIQILVATTVIEVGINVPNANIMLIENAERFGISQLHQLRGRVGRGEYNSYCILVSDAKSSISKKRLKTLVKYDDGFILSEKDLENRGSGDFFGTRQHGLPELKIANLYRDIDALKIVQKVCNEFYTDKILTLPENKALKNKLDDFFNKEDISISL